MGVSYKSWLLHVLPTLGCLLVAWRWARVPDTEADGPVVRVEQGLLLGAHRLTHRDGIPYFSFQGVPYAKPPLGELRFKAPQPPDNWSDVRPALEEGPMCCQPHTEIYWMPPEVNKMFLPRTLQRAWNIVWSLPRLAGQILRFWGQQEDCLYLNIYTKQVPVEGSVAGALSPVVVFIHGGAFYSGTANSHFYGPDYLMREDVVLVTVQYRLGALGFLAPGSREAPGNAGLRDQAAALRWVRRNAARFGGDPGAVTLVGQSAGGASVHYHTLSPGSRGLFHRAVHLSGCALNDWAFVEPRDAARRARTLARLLGCDAPCRDPDSLVAFLRTKTPLEIIDASYNVFQNQETVAGLVVPFVPTVDAASWGASRNQTIGAGEVPADDVFLRASPAEAMRGPDYAPVPTLVGQNTGEGMLLLLPDVITTDMRPSRRNLALLDEDFERAVPLGLGLPRGSEKSRVVADLMRRHYFGERGIRADDETVVRYLAMQGDVLFTVGLGRFVRLLGRRSPQPVFSYLFSFDGRLAVVKKLVRSEFPGVSHGDELGYLFPIDALPAEDVRPGDVDLLVRDRWLRFIANFAKSGAPTSNVDPLLNTTWAPSTTKTPRFMDIGADLSIREGYPFSDTFEFWEKIYNYVGLDFVET